MSEQLALPPGTERFARKRQRLGFRAEPGRTRRLTRIEQVAHVEQALTVSASLPAGEVVLDQRYVNPHGLNHEDRVRIAMDPDEARHIAACLVEAADALDAASATDGGGA